MSDMAKKMASTTAVRMTGRFALCPASRALHPSDVWVQVQCKNRYFVRCGCGTSFYMGPAWNDTHGLTYQQAAAAAAKTGGAVV